jgi:hypothetical protein
MEKEYVRLEVFPDSVAVITIDNPPVNSLAIPGLLLILDLLLLLDSS